MNARGKFGVLHVVLIAGLTYAGFWGVNYGPVYLDNAELKQVGQEFLNRATAIQRVPDERLIELIIERANEKIGKHVETDRFGNTSIKPGMGFKKENVTITRDTVKKMVRIEIKYSRTFQLKPLKKWKTLDFDIVKEGPYL